MKRSLHKQVCILIASIVAFIVIVIFFEGKPMIEAENSPEISFISLTLKENGRIRAIPHRKVGAILPEVI